MTLMVSRDTNRTQQNPIKFKVMFALLSLAMYLGGFAHSYDLCVYPIGHNYGIMGLYIVVGDGHEESRY